MAAKNNKRERERRRQRALAREAQDIGALPKPANLQRRKKALASLECFGLTYFPHRFYLGMSDDLRRAVAGLEETIRKGGLRALAMPRGSGKTSWCEVAVIWAMFTGLHLLSLLLGASRAHAINMLEAIKAELLDNELLVADFPEICLPIAALEDRANRCKGQTYKGKKTKQVWGLDRITLATMPGSKASGATLRVAGLTAGFRGMKKQSTRVTLVIADDPQTDKSAGSPSQCEKRFRILQGAVKGLAGPGQTISVVCPCTVIVRGDLADMLLDRDKNPLWTGQKFKACYAFPERMELWNEYAVRRSDELRNGGDGSKATAFYAQHRADMDRGAVIAWPENFERHELSGIQHVMNMLFADKRAFFAECQNEPLGEDLGEGQLEPKALLARTSGLPRGQLPAWTKRLTGFIDVQEKLLFWIVACWDDDFTGQVIDYGAWPDQGRAYYTANDAQRTIGQAMKELGAPPAGLEGQLHFALGKLAGELLGRTWTRGDGAPFKIELCLVDHGYESDTVLNWARSVATAAGSRLMPSKGFAETAKNKPWEEYDRKKCHKLGTHWLIPLVGATGLRTVRMDVNWWKTFLKARLLQSVGDKGAVAFFGQPGHDHRMLVDHLCAEYWVETQGRGRTLHEWQMRPGQADNHWLDGLVGCTVAASILGCQVLGQATPKRKKVSYAEMQAAAEARRGSDVSSLRSH